jgi:dipeptidyl aminopeptidase/acylaminoacyl peptidase
MAADIRKPDAGLLARFAARRRRWTSSTTYLMALVVCLIWAPPAASQQRAPTVTESLGWTRALAPQLSPDGQSVAYEVQETDWAADAFATAIWLADVSGGRGPPRCIVRRGSAPRWSPDAKRLAFLADHGGRTQVHVVDPRAGAARVLTSAASPVMRLAWSPEGRRIAFTAADPEVPERPEQRDRDGTGHNGADPTRMAHLWLVDVPADDAAPGRAVRLTGGRDFTIGEFAWSPDGQRIAFSAAREPGLIGLASADIYVLDVAAKATRRVVRTPGPDTNPVWSPDGLALAYQSLAGKEEYSYRNHFVAVVPAGGGEPRLLTEGFDERAFPLAWGPSGVYFFALQRTDGHLFRVDPATRAVTRVSRPEHGLFWQFSFDGERRRAAFLRADATHYGEVCVADLDDFAPRALTALGDQLRPYLLASREVIRWQSRDSTPIEGVLVKPPGFDPARQYPLLVTLHGGPAGVDWPVLEYDRYYTFPVEQFAACGALVLRPNFRGSGGYGERFRSLNRRALGLADAPDVLAGVDHLVRQGIADPDRVGAMGHSYGGSLAAFLATTSDRFRAFEVDAGAVDWALNYATTDHPPFGPHMLGAKPWDDPEIYRRVSALTYVKGARTPTLIQHGEADQRVSPANAAALYRALKDQGVPVKLALYRGVGHTADRPRAQRAMAEESLAWFGRWIRLEGGPKSP